MQMIKFYLKNRRASELMRELRGKYKLNGKILCDSKRAYSYVCTIRLLFFPFLFSVIIFLSSQF